MLINIIGFLGTVIGLASDGISIYDFFSKKSTDRIESNIKTEIGEGVQFLFLTSSLSRP